MSRADDYAGHAWIKMKTFVFDPTADYETNYRALLQHHERETSFLIAEVRKLAAEIDRLRDAQTS